MNNFRLSTLVKNTLIVGIISSVVNVALIYIGRMVSNVPGTFGPYQIHSVLILTWAGVVAAAVVYACMRWFIADASKANKWFVILSVIVLIVSFYPDVTIPWSSDPDQVGWTYPTIINLILMHVVAGVLVMYGFTKEKFMSR